MIGLPFSFLLLGGQGYFRGISDLRTPLLIEVVANGVNIVLVTLFVYGFDWGIQGSAAGTAIAQAGMGLAFLVWMLRVTRGRFGFRPDLLRRLLVVGRHLFVRTASLYASFLVAGAVAARFGDAALGAHQIAIQLWYFLALLLDSVAIAGQVIVGRMLGAGDADGAFAASARMIVMTVYLGLGFGALMLALEDVLPRIFTSDPAVLEQAHELWPIFALMQPLNGAVFALDGILIGAGDARYLMWSMLAAMGAARRRSRSLALHAGLGHRRRLVGAARADLRAPRGARRPLHAEAVAGDRLGLTFSTQRFRPGVGLPHRHRALDGLEIVVVELAEPCVHALDELVLRRTALDDLLPLAQALAQLAQMAPDVVEDAEVHERELLRRSPLELVDRRGPRDDVDVGRRRRRQHEPARRDPDAGRIAGVERAVLVREADVVRCVTG